MKQVCPSCLKSVEVPESAAGTDYPCLVCGSKIPVPKNYAPDVASPPAPVSGPPVDRPPPPPGLAPPPQVPSNSDAAVHPHDPREFGISISPKLIDWLPAICLSLIFFLTFFSWIGSYPGGHRLFSQNAWEALAASHTPNSVPPELEDVEKKLDNNLRSSWLLLAYLPMLIVAIFFVWADRFLPHNVTPMSLPGPLIWLTKIWPLRHSLLVALSLLLLGLIVVQGWRGLGLENTLRDHATAKYEDEAKSADTEMKKTIVRVKSGQEYAKFAVTTTTWFSLVFWLHLIAVISLIASLRLANQPGQAAPRLSIRY